MARKHRSDFEGAWHHVMNRGARRQLIFRCATDRRSFLNILGRALGRYDVELHGYALMSNHYHLTVRSLHANLSHAMRDLESTYVLQYNARYGLDGPLFRDRYKNQVVNDERYLKYLLAYIHLNPVAAGLAAAAADARWTSHRAYLGLEPCPPWLTTTFMQNMFGSAALLDGFIADIGSGRIMGPADLDQEGWRVRQAPAGSAWPGIDPAFVPLHSLPRVSRATTLSAEEVLSDICLATGASVPLLRTPVKGRGANPARRFAAWALTQIGIFPLGTVADCLGMSILQLKSLRHRARRNPKSADFERWWEALQEVRRKRK